MGRFIPRTNRSASKSSSAFSRRPAPEALSIDRFAAGKNNAPSFKRKERAIQLKKIEKLRMLKDYSKALKSAGFDSSIRAPGKDRKTLLKKSDPFKRAKLANENRTAAKIESVKKIEAASQRKATKQQERARKQQMYRERTKKGQPIMKNRIFDLLEKIKKET